MVKEEVKDYKNYYYVSVVIVIIILLAIFIPLFVIKPLVNSYKKASQEVEAKKTTVAKLERKLNRLIELKEKEDEIKKDKEKVLAALPKNMDYPRLLVEIKMLVSDSGLTFKNLTFSEAESTSEKEKEASTLTEVSKAQIKLNVSGEYPKFKDFVSRAEKVIRTLGLGSIGIQGINIKIEERPLEKPTTIVDVSLDIDTYYKKGEQ